MTCKTRSAVDYHAAGTADTGTTTEVELDGRVLLITDNIKRDEQCHGVIFIYVE
jgi:hypothetical protein